MPLILTEPWTNEIDLEALSLESKISLTPKEDAIFSFLLSVLQEKQLKTTLRVAGGWVRDKLYGKESDDIDVALDDMYG